MKHMVDRASKLKRQDSGYMSEAGLKEERCREREIMVREAGRYNPGVHMLSKMLQIRLLEILMTETIKGKGGSRPLGHAG